jgi:hypothetical protein
VDTPQPARLDKFANRARRFATMHTTEMTRAIYGRSCSEGAWLGGGLGDGDSRWLKRCVSPNEVVVHLGGGHVVAADAVGAKAHHAVDPHVDGVGAVHGRPRRAPRRVRPPPRPPAIDTRALPPSSAATNSAATSSAASASTSSAALDPRLTILFTFMPRVPLVRATRRNSGGGLRAAGGAAGDESTESHLFRLKIRHHFRNCHLFDSEMVTFSTPYG